MWPNTAARHYHDPVTGMLEEALDHLEPFRHRGFLSAGEDPRKPKIDQLVKRAERIRRYVDGAVEDRFAFPGEFSQSAITIDIHRSVGVQYSEDNSIGTLCEGRFGVVLQKGNALTGCVNKAIGTLRTNGTLKKLQRLWLAKATGAPILK